LSSKNFALSAVIIASIITLVTFLGQLFMTFQEINPIAVFAAIIVALIGVVWFKKNN